MTELPDRVRTALATVDALAPADGGAAEVTSTPFDAAVTASETDGTVRFAVTVEVPTLSAAVDGEVADVVEEGWLETLERRLGDAAMPLLGVDDVDPTVEVLGETVRVSAAFEDGSPERGAADAVALVEYVEGTYMEGVVPGYDYREPVASLRDAARQASE